MNQTNHQPHALQAQADTVRSWLADADRVLITAGAGLRGAAGYDYGDTDRVQELFPALYRLGMRSLALVTSSDSVCAWVWEAACSPVG